MIRSVRFALRAALCRAGSKANPGEPSFASRGRSTPHRLGFEWFELTAGRDMIEPTGATPEGR